VRQNAVAHVAEINLHGLPSKLAALAPQPTPNIELAGRVLDDFGVFCRI